MIIKTDEYGIPRFTKQDLVDIIYSGELGNCHVVICDPDDDIEQFNKALQEQGLPEISLYIPLDVEEKTFDEVCRSEWFMPDEYKNINILEYFGKIDLSKEQRDRVFDELVAYKEKDMLQLLKYMIYPVDYMRENKILWGVGRGSSVSSYVLYLIGVHRVDSLKYGLDWREFLR